MLVKSLYEFNLTGLILTVPILLARFILLSIINPEAVQRAAYFPPVRGIERPAYLVNIITTILLLVTPFFLKIYIHGFIPVTGMIMFVSGLVLYSVTIIQFARPDKKGINMKGLYRFSRNPMYIAFFIYFLGCSLMTRSLILLIVLIVFQSSVHYMIMSEERWCINRFGEDYKEYMSKVRRYI
jgi:protein-S-isoprenylcysteine O-methyltransferase Ste14